MISDINVKVNRDLCFACGRCVQTCILDNLRLSLAPCRQACPLDMNCQGYVRLLAQGKPAEAAEEIRRATPFGRILGRLCARPCEAACEREKIGHDGPVHLRAIKRYLAEAHPEIAEALPELAPATGRRAAVVGSGPAGLMAAYELRRQGHEVSVLEAEEEPGGFLRQVIPAFRLPEAEVDRAVDFLKRMGVTFRTSLAVGRNLPFDQLLAEHDAVLLAIGAGRPRALAVPGRELAQVIQALDLLRLTKAGRPPRLNGSVLVIGGGNTAVDAALTCRRMGVAEVRLVCLEGPREMPAYEEELAEAREEGVVFHHGWGVLGLEPAADGRVRVDLARCLSVFDSAGRFAPALETELGRVSLTAATVVLAVGQAVAGEGLPESLLDPATGLLRGDPLTRQSPAEAKLFVCGDGQTGPTSVVRAMASGREAAISADRFLRGEGLGYDRDVLAREGLVREYEARPERLGGGPRGELERLSLAARSLVVETERVLSPEAARREAERCLSCGRSFEANRTCWYCLPCEIECPTKALEIRMPYQVR